MRTIIRVILGSVLAGMAIFIWGFVAHMLTPLGMMGMKGLPNEPEAMTAVKGMVTTSGWYMFPAAPTDHQMTSEEFEAHMAKAAKGPTGILIVQPNGTTATLGQQLGIELASNIATAFVAAVLLAQTRLSLIGRVLFVTSLGLLSWLSISISYWNWYGFPTDFTIGALIDEVGAALTAGIVLGFIFRPVPAKLEA